MTPEFPLRSEIDLSILLHRESHFGGSFSIMLDYYQKEGKGVSPEFGIAEIQKLAQYEQALKVNLAPELLGGAEAEKIAKVQKAYQELRDLYEKKPQKGSNYPLLIADLILSEENLPEKEIETITAAGEGIVPALIELLRAEDFWDPLFPGYGKAPLLAAHCLGKIGGTRGLYSLFESLGREDFFDENVIIQALKEIGEPAKAFLLQRIQSRPLTEDNERAAIALEAFKDDPSTSSASFHLLLDPEVRGSTPLGNYLAYLCEELQTVEEKERFRALAKDPATPPLLREDIAIIAKAWR